MAVARCRRPWSADEDALLSDPGLTAHELTARTGRTVAAVKRRRCVLRRMGGNEERSRSWGVDPPLLNRPPKPCAKCRREFQPTMRRRLLCESCYRHADTGPYAA